MTKIDPWPSHIQSKIISINITSLYMGGGGCSQNTYVTIYILKTYVVFTCTEIDYSIILIIPLVIAKHLVLHIFKLLDNLYRYDSTIEKRLYQYLSVSISLKVGKIVHAQIMKFFLARYKNPSVCTFYIP